MLLSTIVVGFLFGFMLNSIGASNPNYIIGMLRLRQLHLMKTILTAVGVGNVLLFSAISLKVVDTTHLLVDPLNYGVIIGALLLGSGFALAGYCPGTSLAALASGRRDAFCFLLGGLVATYVYLLLNPYFKSLGFYTEIAAGAATLMNTFSQYHYVLFANPLWGVVQGVVMVVIGYLMPERILN